MSTLERLEEYAVTCREARDLGRELPVIPDDLRDLSGVNLSGVNLVGAILGGVDLSGVDLRGADLRGVILSGVDLRGADLSGADLSGAILSGVDLSGVDLSGADLRWVIPRGVNLRGADLRGVDLRWADLDGTIAKSVAAKIYKCWRIGQYLAYGCETHLLHNWPLDEAAARHPNDHAAHAEVRSIVARLISES